MTLTRFRFCAGRLRFEAHGGAFRTRSVSVTTQHNGASVFLIDT